MLCANGKQCPRILQNPHSVGKARAAAAGGAGKMPYAALNAAMQKTIFRRKKTFVRRIASAAFAAEAAPRQSGGFLRKGERFEPHAAPVVY